MEEKEKEMELTSTPSNSTGGTGHMAEYQSNIKLFDEIENFLLGSFDKSGKYSLSQEMVDELIKMDKIYSYAFGEVVFCESETFFENVGHIQFTVKIEQNKKDMVAKLLLVQEVKRANGMLKKNAVTELLTYQAANSPSFVNDCFEKFNIHSKKEDGLQKKEFENEEVSVVRERLKYLNGKRMLLDEKDALFKELVEKKLALLAKYGVGKKILAEYNAMIQKGRFNKLAKGYYRHLNSILDNIMEKNKAELLKDPFFVAQWGKLNANISSKIRNEVNNPLKLTQSDKEKMAVKEASEKEKEKLKESKPNEEKKKTGTNEAQQGKRAPRPGKGALGPGKGAPGLEEGSKLVGSGRKSKTPKEENLKTDDAEIPPEELEELQNTTEEAAKEKEIEENMFIEIGEKEESLLTKENEELNKTGDIDEHNLNNNVDEKSKQPSPNEKTDDEELMMK